ncbi:hypothetical protein [Synechococcus sp. A15-28]|jgi:hypothetical protein|uniref:hypothetical protein n=1 Tax=Synechococcus sp. A15-28 TaxID=1050638 RepID=UPI0016477359|nr:hypothetical protein [Synechococcus sp. A15-28]QNI42417.1 hypothetical protein SynA1528_01387 [Synechococcus sp. A15-28]|tara:strand:+ start:174 stop:434 length:261 start_codon:yes stop_codon:yes gene_type:complete
MALLWENLATQLDRVRATTTAPLSSTSTSSTAVADDPSDRRRRLETALEAIKDSGNAMMIESLKAAIEGRQANLNLPELPDGIAKF